MPDFILFSFMYVKINKCYKKVKEQLQRTSQSNVQYQSPLQKTLTHEKSEKRSGTV